MSGNHQGAIAGRRLASLDALRGFDMFWIIGGDYLIHLLARAADWPLLAVLSDQLRHVPWAGLHAYDLIFPLFMFLSGVSLSLSLGSGEHDKAGRHRFLAKVARRAAILVALGVIYNFGWSIDPERFRLASVLGQIGIAYLVVAAVLLKLKSWQGRGLAVVFVLAIVAYFQLLFPVPGIGPGLLTPEGIANGWLDRSFLPGRLYGGSFDPEGILSVFSSISVTLLGALAGGFLGKHRQQANSKTVIRLCGFGAALIMLGLLLAPGYPIIKAVWTVPFDLTAAGISMLLLALFYLIIDVSGYRRWAFFFTVIGINSIGIYMAARFLAYPLFISASDYAGHPAYAISLIIAVIATEWLALWWCFRRGLFLKV